MTKKRKSIFVFVAIVTVLTAIELFLITFVRNEIISELILKDKSIWFVDSAFSMHFVICTGISWAVLTGFAAILFYTDRLLSIKGNTAIIITLSVSLVISAVIVVIPFFTINKRTEISQNGIREYSSSGQLIRAVGFDKADHVSVKAIVSSTSDTTKGTTQHYINYSIHFSDLDINIWTNKGLWNVDPNECIVMIDNEISEAAYKSCYINFDVAAFTDNKELQDKLDKVFTEREGKKERNSSAFSMAPVTTTLKSPLDEKD